MRRIVLLCFSLAWLLSVAAQTGDPGRLYGTVTLRAGAEVSGALRWDGEEVLWIHHFNGDKTDSFDLDELQQPDRERILANRPGPQLEINGHIVELAKWLGDGDLGSPSFGLEFGAIDELQPGGGDRVKIVLRDGSLIQAEGGSNDIGADIEVMVSDGPRQTLDWDDIERIRFHAPPAAPPQFPAHLFGRVETDAGNFEGFVEWDQDERRADERLDGEVDGVDEEIEFGSILSIAKEGDGSQVTLMDGQRKFMTGTNDVNPQNRGIVVTGQDFGQVDIPWSAFRSVTFAPPPASLPGFADFAGIGPLKGRLTGGDGQQRAGRLVFNLDHSYQAETLEGRREGILYRIPMRLIEALEPLDERQTRVRLRVGGVLLLGAGNDVTGDNSGIVVRSDADPHAYFPWEDVKRIEFD